MFKSFGKFFALFRALNPFVQDIRDGKKPYQSRTAVWNVLIPILMVVYPPAADWATANFAVFVSLWGSVNVLLRLATKGKVSLTE
jgi:hypothetical protein